MLTVVYAEYHFVMSWRCFKNGLVEDKPLTLGFDSDVTRKGNSVIFCEKKHFIHLFISFSLTFCHSINQ
jgi:hypothetical protein